MQKEYLIKKGKEITIEEMSKILKVSKEDINIAIESARPVESIENKVFADKGEKTISIADKISTQKDEQELITNKIVIKDLIKGVEEKDKEVRLIRYYKEKTQSQIAKILGISQVQVSRIEKKVLEKMRNKLVQKGI